MNSEESGTLHFKDGSTRKFELVSAASGDNFQIYVETKIRDDDQYEEFFYHEIASVF